jgi:hypothetical protein
MVTAAVSRYRMGGSGQGPRTAAYRSPPAGAVITVPGATPSIE